MSDVKVNRLTNGNLYSSGNSLLGMIEELTIPSVKAKDVDVKVLGLAFEFKVPGGFEAMSGKLKMNAIYAEMIEEFGDPTQIKPVQARGSLQKFDTSGISSEQSVVVFMNVRFKDVLPAIGLKQNDNPEQESEFNCYYLRLEIDGERYLEVDVFTNTFFVKDKDVLAQYRINIGVQ